MKNKKILLIGPYPPPFGGVSIHIKRLKPLLAGRFDVDVVDEARGKKDNIFIQATSGLPSCGTERSRLFMGKSSKNF